MTPFYDILQKHLRHSSVTTFWSLKRLNSRKERPQQRWHRYSSSFHHLKEKEEEKKITIQPTLFWDYSLQMCHCGVLTLSVACGSCRLHHCWSYHCESHPQVEHLEMTKSLRWSDAHWSESFSSGFVCSARSNRVVSTCKSIFLGVFLLYQTVVSCTKIFSISDRKEMDLKGNPGSCLSPRWTKIYQNGGVRRSIFFLYTVHNTAVRFCPCSPDSWPMDHDRLYASSFNTDAASLWQINFIPGWHHGPDWLSFPALKVLQCFRKEEWGGQKCDMKEFVFAWQGEG